MRKEDYSHLTEASPSVQVHLGIIQNVIQRMASNSSQCKAWCITIVSAILVIVADKSKPDYAWIALFPAILFLVLDTYYLALEKGFRVRYNTFIKKLHSKDVTPNDLYWVSSSGNVWEHRMNAIKSFSIWGFYGGVIALIVIARYIVLL
jgi:hypothetical protein